MDEIRCYNIFINFNFICLNVSMNAQRKLEIFEAISKSLRDPGSDILDQQRAFEELHASDFGGQGADGEETKHQAVVVHKDAISLLKTNVSVKLGGEFSSDEITAFFKEFVKDSDKYEAKDPQTKTQLFRVLDSDAFKTRMLKPSGHK